MILWESIALATRFIVYVYHIRRWCCHCCSFYDRRHFYTCALVARWSDLVLKVTGHMYSKAYKRKLGSIFIYNAGISPYHQVLALILDSRDQHPFVHIHSSKLAHMIHYIMCDNCIWTKMVGLNGINCMTDLSLKWTVSIDSWFDLIASILKYLTHTKHSTHMNVSAFLWSVPIFVSRAIK